MITLQDVLNKPVLKQIYQENCWNFFSFGTSTSVNDDNALVNVSTQTTSACSESVAHCLTGKNTMKNLFLQPRIKVTINAMQNYESS